MKAKEFILSLLLFTLIVFFFFYKSILNGYVPFPGDLLIGEYAPYNSYSFMGYAPGAYPNKGQDFDVVRLLYPEKEFSISMFKNLEFPLWNPYNFAGNPHIASLQSGSFYPLNILFIFLSHITAWTIFIMLQPILITIFTYLFARELRLGIKSSIFSALIFAFSSYSIVWLEYGNIGHSIAFMPFAMWISLKNLKKPTILKSIIISLSLTFAILAGYIQTAFYVFIFLFGYVVFNIFLVDKNKRVKKIFIFFLVFTLPILFSAVQLLPMVELIGRSARVPYSLSAFLSLLIPPFHAITMFVPDFFGNPATRNYWLTGTYIERVTYIGVIPLIFIFYSFFKKQNSTFWFFAISAIVVLFLTFDTIVGRIIYSFQIPLVSTAVPTRIMFLYCFCISMIAGFGLDAFIKDPNKKVFLKVIFILGGIYTLVWLFTILMPLIDKSSWVQNLNISKRNLLLPTAIFFVSSIALLSSFYFSKYRKFFVISLMLLTILDLFYFFHKITPFVPREALYPPTEVLTQLKKIQGIDRSWGYGSAYMNTNLHTYEKIFTADGYNALHIRRYGELLSSSKDGKIASSIARSDPVIAQGYGENDLRDNKYRQRILDLFGTRYILHKLNSQADAKKADNQTFNPSIYKLVWSSSPWQIYENTNVLPRVFLASEYIVEKDRDEIIKTILDDKFNLRNKIILEEEIIPKMDLSKDSQAKVDIKAYTPNKIIINTSSTENMLLFISDNYYKGWEVSVDKEFGKIYRADYSFRAVPVIKGDHEVTFSYFPESFDLGLKISIGSLILSIILVLLTKLRGFYYVKK